MNEIEVLEDNTDEVQRLIPKALARGLEKVGMVAEGYAKQLCPIDTGRLRNSITHVVRDLEVWIGTNVSYASYVETGGRNPDASGDDGEGGEHDPNHVPVRLPHPFLRPAATNHADQYRKIIEDSLRDA